MARGVVARVGVPVSHWTSALRNLRACREAVAWCETQPDLATAWATCESGDWLLWLVGRTTTSAPWSEERKPLVRCAVECAALARPHIKSERTLAVAATMKAT